MTVKALFMETTRIAAERTVSEIQKILAMHGASQILIEFDAMKVSAVSFRVNVGGNDIHFRLPCRWKNMECLLRERGKRPASDDTYEGWARRVSWRQILRWAEAQFALVDTGMVKIHEVFLPYAQNNKGQTIFEQLEGSHFKMLGMDK